MSRRIIPHPLPYSLDTLKAVALDPVNFREHITEATAGKIGALAFCLLHLHKSFKGDILTCDSLYEFYSAFCRSHGLDALTPGVFGRELSRWYHLVTGKEKQKSRVHINHSRVYVHPGVRYSETPLDVTSQYSGVIIEKLDLRVNRLATWRRRSRRDDYSQDFINQLHRNPSDYKSFLEGEPIKKAAAAAFCANFLEVHPHNASTPQTLVTLAYGPPVHMALTANVYETYTRFCDRNGYPRLEKSPFGREVARYWALRTHNQGKLRVCRRRYDKTRRYAYEGITLNP